MAKSQPAECAQCANMSEEIMDALRDAVFQPAARKEWKAGLAVLSREDRSGLTEARRRGAGKQPWRQLMAGCSIAPRT